MECLTLRTDSFIPETFPVEKHPSEEMARSYAKDVTSRVRECHVEIQGQLGDTIALYENGEDTTAKSS